MRMVTSSFWADSTGPFRRTTSAFHFCHCPSGSNFTLGIVFNVFFFSLWISTLLLSLLHCPPPLHFPEQDQNRLSCSFLTQPDSILPSCLWQILSALDGQDVFNLLQNWYSLIFSSTPKWLPNNFSVLLWYTAAVCITNYQGVLPEPCV